MGSKRVEAFEALRQERDRHDECTLVKVPTGVPNHFDLKAECSCGEVLDDPNGYDAHCDTALAEFVLAREAKAWEQGFDAGRAYAGDYEGCF